MTKAKFFHITKSENKGWTIKPQNSNKVVAVTSTKVQAVQRAAQIARATPTGVTVVIHKINGEIQSQRTYRVGSFTHRGSEHKKLSGGPRAILPRGKERKPGGTDDTGPESPKKIK